MGKGIMYWRTSSFLSMLAAVSCALLLFACRETAQDRTAVQVELSSAAALVDSPENRRREAEKCIAAYPVAEFGADLTEQAAAIVGREVAEDTRAKFRARVSAQDFAEIRLQILVRNFTAKELAKLAEIYSTSEGKSLMRKQPQYIDSWREFLSPVLLEALSNKPQE